MKDKSNGLFHSGVHPLLVFAALFCTGAAAGAYLVSAADTGLMVGKSVAVCEFTAAFLAAFRQYIVIVLLLVICANLSFGWIISYIIVFLSGLWHSAGYAGLLIASDIQTAFLVSLFSAFLARSIGLAFVIFAAAECAAISCVVFGRTFGLGYTEKRSHFGKRYLRVAVYTVLSFAAAVAEAITGSLVYSLLR